MDKLKPKGINNIKFIIEALIKIGEAEGNKGKIKCPRCEGILHYSRDNRNGHIWGKCETENCLKWIQ